MKEYYKQPLAVQLANDVLGMHRELERLREENEELSEYRDKYNELLTSSIRHGEDIIGGILGILVKPGVMKALVAS